MNRNLRQHRIDCTAWSKAYLPNKTGASPMFIASPSPFNSPCKLLFDASARNTSIYKKLSKFCALYDLLVTSR